MIRLQTRDLKDVLEVSRCALECDSMESLQQETLARIERSLGARSSVYAHFNKNKTQIQMIEGAGHGVHEDAVASWCATYHSDDPFMRRYLAKLSKGSSGVVISSEVITHREYISTSFYKNFMQPQSIYHVMIIGLESDYGPVGVFGLHRPFNAPAFSKAEVAKANLLIPHLKGAVERVAAREMHSECRWLADHFADALADGGILILDRHLRPVFISQNARWRLNCTDELPEEFILACARALEGLNQSQLHNSFSYKTQGLTIAADIRPMTHANTDPRYMIRLGASFQDTPVIPQMTARMLKLGLSRREMDIAQLLSQGLTSLLIADKLNISVRTVNNHLRSIYQKARVHNRTSLIYRLSK